MFIIAQTQFQNYWDFMRNLAKLAIFVNILFSQVGCQTSTFSKIGPPSTPETPKIIADRFATQAKDKKDNWCNAQDFTVNNHLGEDWNANSGGNTDCGEPVYAAADGIIVYAENAGTGWGNVVIIEHNLPDGKKVQTLYGHLQKMVRTSGETKMREQIGEIGNADGRYLCHLHFELREDTCPMWNQAGNGYDNENAGWRDPSDFIDNYKK
jgi:murein DD-endopeptidase MepM/ murein hydrolase activator NlpD